MPLCISYHRDIRLTLGLGCSEQAWPGSSGTRARASSWPAPELRPVRTSSLSELAARLMIAWGKL
jgi:hypothetical protein